MNEKREKAIGPKDQTWAGRNSSFELLRLILMCFIIIHHIVFIGVGLKDITNSNVDTILREKDFLFFCIINCFCIPAVNIFVLISGYFEIKSRIKKTVSLLISMIFYTIAFTVPYLLFTGDYFHALTSLSVLSHSPYWFLIDYLFLMLFTPLLNMMFMTSNKKNIHFFIIGLLVISTYFGFVWGHPANSNGYTLLQFIMLYCIGRYIRVYEIRLRKKWISFILYIACSVLCGYGMYWLHAFGYNKFVRHLSYYNNPLLIISSISLLLFFKEIKFHSKFINKLAESSLSVYLFSCSKFFWLFVFPLIPLLYIEAPSILAFAGEVVIFTFITLVVSIGINQLQLKINKPLTGWICNRLRWRE